MIAAMPQEQETKETITIETKAYGSMQIDPSSIIYFPDGIFAFEQQRKFAIVSDKEDAVFQWLQSIDDTQLAFLVANPLDITSSYQPAIHAEDLITIDKPQLDDVKIWCIVTIPPNEPKSMTINLQGPLIVNSSKNLGGQFISSNEKHNVRASVVDLMEQKD